jgi:hypothetical protein
MDVFQLLEEQHNVIHDDLAELLHGTDLDADEAVARSGQLFAAVRKHFDSQEKFLLRYIEEFPEVQTMVHSFRKDRTEILDDIEQIVLWHVDEPGYAKMLQEILRALERHMKMAEMHLFPAFRACLPSADLARINHDVRALIFI